MRSAKNQFYLVGYKTKTQFHEICYVSLIFIIDLYLILKLKTIKVLELLNFLKTEFINHARSKFVKEPKQFNSKYFKFLLTVFHIANMIVKVSFKSSIIKLRNLAFFSIKPKIQYQSFIVFILLRHFIKGLRITFPFSLL